MFENKKDKISSLEKVLTKVCVKLITGTQAFDFY